MACCTQDKGFKARENFRKKRTAKKEEKKRCLELLK
jgi:hypothetical protein